MMSTGLGCRLVAHLLHWHFRVELHDNILTSCYHYRCSAGTAPRAVGWKCGPARHLCGSLRSCPFCSSGGWDLLEWMAYVFRRIWRLCTRCSRSLKHLVMGLMLSGLVTQEQGAKGHLTLGRIHEVLLT